MMNLMKKITITYSQRVFKDEPTKEIYGPETGDDLTRFINDEWRTTEACYLKMLDLWNNTYKLKNSTQLLLLPGSNCRNSAHLCFILIGLFFELIYNDDSGCDTNEIQYFVAPTKTNKDMDGLIDWNAINKELIRLGALTLVNIEEESVLVYTLSSTLFNFTTLLPSLISRSDTLVSIREVEVKLQLPKIFDECLLEALILLSISYGNQMKCCFKTHSDGNLFELHENLILYLYFFLYDFFEITFRIDSEILANVIEAILAASLLSSEEELGIKYT
ncbi:hypothetical protein K502DRAFT_351343 [Neoconidiobolus thromboides FSU 785]|nr:hypothetical protein K502DRAFT_351343 [Neoconidiobolus thromboides FSU 785]